MKSSYAKLQSKLGLQDLETILALHRGRTLAGADGGWTLAPIA